MAEDQLVEAPRTRPVQARAAERGSLYRVVWRWHFYAGILVAPVLIVVAVTGGLYIFKDELERVVYPRLMFVTPGTSSVSYDSQAEAARRVAPKGYKAQLLAVPADPTRATSVLFAGPERSFREVFVDPRDGKVLGDLERDGIFGVILDLHRRLFVGDQGRAIVELTTCWTIVLLVTGLYLWWPRGRWKARGTLVPRLRAKPYAVLRDMHAVAGFYLVPVALTIAGTGLLYTLIWGGGYRLAAAKTGAYGFLTDPPKASSSPGSKPLPLDELVAIGRRRYPGLSLTVNLSPKPGRAVILLARGGHGPNIWGGLALDPSTGAVVGESTPNTLPALGWWANWNYPLHIGSVLGLPTKILWLIACAVLVALPVTGIWMWWERRPTGRTGFPRRPDARVPGWLIALILALAVLLPTVGASLVLIAIGERALGIVSGRLRRARAIPGGP